MVENELSEESKMWFQRMMKAQEERDSARQEVARLTETVAELLKEKNDLSQRIHFLRYEWTRFGARACPACLYENGKFIRTCMLCKEIDRLQELVAALESSSRKEDKGG